ncbi:MAG: polymer-forming cytoskeletal protein [Deltaproteobacteria bacterium]|nr:polymer-forming cytoskeletal protein [Deltaproteobacteria bacterium]
MFSKKRGSAADLPEITGFIGKGMTVEGRLGFEGAARIDGRFKGEVRADSTLFVGEGAYIEGEINVDVAIISGEVRGVVAAKTRVELKAPAKVYGDIKTPTLIICEGVVFEGTSTMTNRERPAGLRPVERAVN